MQSEITDLEDEIDQGGKDAGQLHLIDADVLFVYRFRNRRQRLLILFLGFRDGWGCPFGTRYSIAPSRRADPARSEARYLC